MKQIYLLSSAILLFALLSSCTQHQSTQDLKVLYVGYRADLPLPQWATLRLGNNAQADYKERMSDFEKMLQEYFSVVKTVDVRDYSEEMSKDFDVTIFDGLPKPIIDPVVEINEEYGLPLVESLGTYLSESFSSPAILMGHVTDDIGNSLGLKMNWYCHCLYYHALNTDTTHAIFHEPFNVRITLEKRDTPAEIYAERTHSEGWIFPREIPMWRVSSDNARKGLVSGWYGFNENDAEYISGGHSLKSYRTMAIGRHGNFLMWGFEAAPQQMTDEAKTVFANAVCYINKFKGERPKARSFQKIIARERIEDFIDVLSPEGYQTYVNSINEYNEWLRKKQSAITEHADSLSEQEKNLLERKPATPEERLTFINGYTRFGILDSFNMDIDAARQYLIENVEFYNGGSTRKSDFEIDQDVKSIGISNRDLRLLHACIKMLKDGVDTEKALRILKRYTNHNFLSAEEWSNWLTNNEKLLFFSEVADYKFVGDSKAIKKTFEKEKKNKDNLVSVSTTIERLSGNSGVVKVKFKIKEGCHIYASAADDFPMTLTKVSLDFPNGITADGEMIIPEGIHLSEGEDFKVYINEVVFVQNIKIDDNLANGSKITGKADYQCCKSDICMPQSQVIIKADVPD